VESVVLVPICVPVPIAPVHTDSVVPLASNKTSVPAATVAVIVCKVVIVLLTDLAKIKEVQLDPEIALQ
jgi:hypothetical protein